MPFLSPFLALHRRIEIETDLFQGCAVIWAQNLGSSPEGLFAGERRKTSITVQVCSRMSVLVTNATGPHECLGSDDGKNAWPADW